MRTLCILVVLGLGFMSPGCGRSDETGTGPIPMCGMACVENGFPDLQSDSMEEGSCLEAFHRFEASHPGGTCGYAWIEVPQSECVSAIIKTFIYLVLCGAECFASTDGEDCLLSCLPKYVQFEGNCLACSVENLLDFYACVDKNPLTPEDVDACLVTFIRENSACRP